jgi:OmpA-OmpF porin, OOP family
MRYIKDYGKVLILLISISLTSSLFAQDQVKEGLFKEANVLLKDAENVQASLYSPSIFQKGFELFARAEKDFKDGKKLDDIRKRLREASVQLKRSIEITRLSKLTLEEITTSRNAAVEQLSVDWAPVLFQEAEEIFRKAAKKVEDGNTNDAKKLATEGSKVYRNTELTAIKNRILNDAWTELQACKEQEVEKYAPLTLENAKTFAVNAESILDQDRYSQENAATVASEATYEAKHALFLASVVKELQDKKEGLETYLLDIEQQFAKISSTLNLDLEFDGGFQNPAYKMVEAIVDLKEKAKGQ